MNKKVRNATPNIFNGIRFRSRLETYAYQQLSLANIPFEYEPIKFELLPTFKFLDKVIRAITLTPDFIGDNFILEVKGHPNDSFPMKWKMFLHHLLTKGLEDKYTLYIAHSQKEVRECIEKIKNQTKK